MGNTKVDLVKDLLKKPKSVLRDALIVNAKMGHFHDFESESETPKTDLINELNRACFHDLAKKVMSGQYDQESPSSEEKEALMRALKNS